EVNDILPMASMIGRASNEVMSMCSTGVDRIMALRLVPRAADFDLAADFLDLVLGMALLTNAAEGTLDESVPSANVGVVGKVKVSREPANVTWTHPYPGRPSAPPEGQPEAAPGA